jgi:hypothetical protein
VPLIYVCSAWSWIQLKAEFSQKLNSAWSWNQFRLKLNLIQPEAEFDSAWSWIQFSLKLNLIQPGAKFNSAWSWIQFSLKLNSIQLCWIPINMKKIQHFGSYYRCPTLAVLSSEPSLQWESGCRAHCIACLGFYMLLGLGLNPQSEVQRLTADYLKWKDATRNQ